MNAQLAEITNEGLVRALLNHSSMKNFLKLGLSTFLCLGVAFGGDGSGGGGNECNGKQLSVLRDKLHEMDRGQQTLETIQLLKQGLPQLGLELEAAAKKISFIKCFKKQKELPSELTGIVVPTEQTARHQLTSEVYYDDSLYSKKDDQNKDHFLLQEVLEEMLLKKFPSLPGPKMHENARALTDIILSGHGLNAIQVYLAENGIGYYALKTQRGQSSNSNQIQSNDFMVYLSSDSSIDISAVPDKSNNQEFRVGDTLKFQIKATQADAKTRYKLRTFTGVGFNQKQTDYEWQADPIITYTLTKEDVNSGGYPRFVVIAGDPNNPGEFESNYQSQVYRIPSKNMVHTEGKAAPELGTPNVSINDKKVENPSDLDSVKIGDRIQIEVEVNDPQSRPVETKWKIDIQNGRGSFSHPISTDWSISGKKEKFEYTIQQEDVGKTHFTMRLYGRNNDGLNNDWRDFYLDGSEVDFSSFLVYAPFVLDRDEKIVGHLKSRVNGTPLMTRTFTNRIKGGYLQSNTRGDGVAPNFSLTFGDSVSLRIDQFDSAFQRDHITFICNYISSKETCQEYTGDEFKYIVNKTDYDNWFQHAGYDDDQYGKKMQISFHLKFQHKKTGQEIDGPAELITIDPLKSPLRISVSTLSQTISNLTRDQAEDLYIFLESTAFEGCEVVKQNLIKFIQDPNRQNMEIIAFFPQGIDEDTRSCIDQIDRAGQVIFNSARQSEGQVLTPQDEASPTNLAQ